MTNQEGRNTMIEIRDYLSDPNHPFQPGEFAEFWKNLTDEEREEFKNTPLNK